MHGGSQPVPCFGVVARQQVARVARGVVLRAIGHGHRGLELRHDNIHGKPKGGQNGGVVGRGDAHGNALLAAAQTHRPAVFGVIDGHERQVGIAAVEGCVCVDGVMPFCGEAWPWILGNVFAVNIDMKREERRRRPKIRGRKREVLIGGELIGHIPKVLLAIKPVAAVV